MDGASPSKQLDFDDRPTTVGSDRPQQLNPVGLDKEIEVQYAELETRVRQYCLELIHPTVIKAVQLQQDMEKVKKEAQRSTTLVADMANTSLKAEQQVAMVECFREEMSKWDSERRQVQAKVADDLSSMKQELDVFRYSLERKDTNIHSVHRTVDRVMGELVKSQEASENLRNHVETRLGQLSRVLNGAKTDLEVRQIALETKLHRLSDEVFGGSSGLTVVNTLLNETSEFVKALSDEMKRMQVGKANVRQLELVQEEVNESIRAANSNVSALRETLDSMVSDVKEHFVTATNTVAAHNEGMISEVRSSYQEELNQSATLRSEIVEFMQETKRRIEKFDEAMNFTSTDTQAMIEKVQIDLEEVARKRKQDKSNNELEQKFMQEQLTSVNGSSDAVSRSLDHIANVLWTLIQSERVASALSSQDDIDRTKVALMGYRGPKPADGHAGLTCTRIKDGRSTSKSRSKPPSPDPDVDGPATAEDSSGPVISVDNRCLSCSGQAQTIIAGFKMACLQYTPGPVSFAKKTYERADLLDLRQKLLHQAHEALNSGPVSVEKKDLFASKDLRLPKTSDEDAEGRRSSAKTPPTDSQLQELRDPYNKDKERTPTGPTTTCGPKISTLKMPRLGSRNTQMLTAR